MRPATRFHVGIALGVAAAAAAVLLHGSREAPAKVGAASVADWCAEGLEPIPGDACFAVPAKLPDGPVPLVVYLHGRYSDETTRDEQARQTRVARLATSKGFAVVAFRGRRGQCTDPTLSDYWCWPSNERNAADGPAFVSGFTSGLAVAAARVPLGRKLLLGFSNGGYFAALIATRALMPLDAVVVAHAGPVEPTHAIGAKPPMLLVTADDDPSNDEVLRLDAELAQAGWPHALVAREGGHDLPDWDVEMALAFFSRTASERWPLSPPLSTRAARRRAPEAGPEAGPDEAGPPAAPSDEEPAGAASARPGAPEGGEAPPAAAAPPDTE